VWDALHETISSGLCDVSLVHQSCWAAEEGAPCGADRHKIGPYTARTCGRTRTCFEAGCMGRVLGAEGTEDKLRALRPSMCLWHGEAAEDGGSCGETGDAILGFDARADGFCAAWGPLSALGVGASEPWSGRAAGRSDVWGAGASDVCSITHREPSVHMASMRRKGAHSHVLVNALPSDRRYTYVQLEVRWSGTLRGCARRHPPRRRGC
jgi:hypothetical protein